MRVLLLILDSEGHPYDQFREVWRKYMTSHPNVDCYFYRGNPNLSSDYVLDNDTLWIRIPETHPHLFERTVRAFRYFVNMRPNIYDFVFRPNSSALVNLGMYYELCKTFPKQRFCSAVTGSYQQAGLDKFPSGSGFTLSFDLVKRFARQYDLKQVYLDDVSVGYYLQQWRIPIAPSTRFAFQPREYSDEELTAILASNFHLRFSNLGHRDWDVMAMNMIADRIYGKK